MYVCIKKDLTRSKEEIKSLTQTLSEKQRYVYVYVYVCVCMCASTRAKVMNVCMHVYMYVCMYVHIERDLSQP